MNNKPITPDARIIARLQHVLAIHFDPDTGTPYWLDRERELGIDVRREIRTPRDLARLGPMPADVLAERKIEEVVPKSRWAQRAEFIIAETGGTLGPPKFAVHRRDEWEDAFITPFTAAARRAGFPRGENWLFVGPTGPHIIGKAARRCAEAMGAPDPFTVDFDPRWARKLPDASFARTRYLRHIEEQALRIIVTQRVGVIFSTPPVLDSLHVRMTDAQRRRIRGLHLGGMSVSPECRRNLVERFPAAVILAGYGNTLFGMAPELAHSTAAGTSYYPWGIRMLVDVVDAEVADPNERIRQRVPHGTRGQVMVHRLDETQFIPNMLERDTAVSIPPPTGAGTDAAGFVLAGIREPQPPPTDSKHTAGAVGLY